MSSDLGDTRAEDYRIHAARVQPSPSTDWASTETRPDDTLYVVDPVVLAVYMQMISSAYAEQFPSLFNLPYGFSDILLIDVQQRKSESGYKLVLTAPGHEGEGVKLCNVGQDLTDETLKKKSQKIEEFLTRIQEAP